MTMALRTLASKHPLSLTRLFSTRPLLTRPLSPLLRFRPLLGPAVVTKVASFRCFSTSRTASSLNDPSPNWSNRPPKETILLDGCDFEHWLVVVEPPDPSLTRDDIIKSYIKTLAQVVGSEEDARFKIYSVSTKHYFAFGALVSEELSYKLKEIPGVRWVLPDSYLDVKNKDYGGEPFINGEAVPYDPKYHEEWVRNNARANERNRRNDRPRNSDRSRNFERRRENMQNFQNRPPMPPMPNQEMGAQGGQNPMPPPGQPPMPNNTMPPREGPNMAGPNFGGYQNQAPNYQGNMLNNEGGMTGGGPPGNSGYQGPPPNAYQGPGGYQAPPNSYQRGPGGYQGPPNAYQGGPGVYPGPQGSPQGGPPGYQGAPNSPHGGPVGGNQGAPNFPQGSPQGGPPGYQGAPNSPHGGPVGNQGAPNFPQGSPQGGPPGYQGPNSPHGGPVGGNQGAPNFPQGGPPGYQGQGGPGAYQGAGSSHQGGGAPNPGGNGFQGGGSPFQPRDMPGRDQ